MRRLKLLFLLASHPTLDGSFASAARSAASYLSLAANAILSLGLLLGAMRVGQGGELGQGVIPGALNLAILACSLGLALCVWNLMCAHRALRVVAPKLISRPYWDMALCAALGMGMAFLMLGLFIKGYEQAHRSLIEFVGFSLFVAFYSLISRGSVNYAMGLASSPHPGALLLLDAQTKSLALIERQRLLLASSGRNPPPKARGSRSI